MNKKPIGLYFISWAVYDGYKHFFDKKYRKRLTSTNLSFWADFIVQGNDRKVIKDRSGDYTDKDLSKSELAFLIKAFDGIVIVK